jgi:light-regulated signal transduction histidine kinase (bacteriophytochrome)
LLNINDAILAVIALVGAEAQRNRVLLRTELSNDLPLVLGDRIQLQQVILNLIMNAIEAVREIDQTQRKVLVVSRKAESTGALVEVASKGIGAGIAKAFGAEGAAVIVNYARDQAGAERVVREITGKGGRAIAVQGDVAQRSDAQRVVAEAKKPTHVRC